jgi:hypothetical protein
MAQHALGLAVGGLDILLAAQPRSLLSVDGNLQDLLAASQRFDLDVERLEASRRFFRLEGERAQLFRELAQGPLPPEQ